MIKKNKKATAVRPVVLAHARARAHSDTHMRKAYNLAIRLSPRCHMGTVCASQWPLGLSTNRKGWQDR